LPCFFGGSFTAFAARWRGRIFLEHLRKPRLPGRYRIVRDTPPAIPMLGPVFVAELDHLYLAAGRGGMDKAIIAHINADMGKAPTQRIEEHQVARLERVLIDFFAQFADGKRVMG